MLKPEVAEARLRDIHDDEWLDKRLAALAKLPAPMRRAGQHLLDAEDGDDEESSSSEKQAALRLTNSLSSASRAGAKDRRKFLETLFPTLSEEVDAALSIFPRLPYQIDWGGRAFRAPSHPHLCVNKKRNWLRTLLQSIQGHDHDLAWYAAWAPHLSQYYSADALGLLFAAAIDRGDKAGNEVFEILIASARGEHDVGAMGRHVSRALLVAERPDGWEFLEKMLLAARRQEGLRQAILEAVDESHPEAFRRVLRLILDHDLGRFSSVVRALNVWFGFLWDSVNIKVVNETLTQVLSFLDDEEARTNALEKGDANSLYLALWTLAFEDAVAAIEPTARLLQERDVERRFVAVYLLQQLGLDEADRQLCAAIDDDDLRIALTAHAAATGPGMLAQSLELLDFSDDDFLIDAEEDVEEFRPPVEDLFEKTERLLARLPGKKIKLNPLVWPWTEVATRTDQVAGALVKCLGKRPPTRLLAHLPTMNSFHRGETVTRLAAAKRWDAATRDVLFALVGDSSAEVREAALKAVKNCKPTSHEAQELEAQLTRKPADLRRAILTLLLNQADTAVLDSARRLLAASNERQRLGGLELLRQLVDARRRVDECQGLVEKYRADDAKLTADEERRIAVITGSSARKTYTLDDALGLMDPSQHTKPVPPRNRNVKFMTPAAFACVQALDDLIHEHRETPITHQDWDGSSKTQLLGNTGHVIAAPSFDGPVDFDGKDLPLREVFEAWWHNRPDTLRDRDGLELVRAVVRMQMNWDDRLVCDPRDVSKPLRNVAEPLVAGGLARRLRYRESVRGVILWLLRLHLPENCADFLLDAAETAFALIPSSELRGVSWRDWPSPFAELLDIIQELRGLWKPVWTKAHEARLWGLLRWHDEPTSLVPRRRPRFESLAAAYRCGAATEADVLDDLVGPRPEEEDDPFFGSLLGSSYPPPHRDPDTQAILPLVDRCRERILEIEFQRGESPTVASRLVLAIRSFYGVDLLIRSLTMLGDNDFCRDTLRNRGLSRTQIFSHIIQFSYPLEEESPARFAAAMKNAGIGEGRLVQLAFFSPQWVSHVEHALGWRGFTEGVWWYIAHTRYGSPGEERDTWKQRLRERTPLTAEELEEGAVDVSWFHRVYNELGRKHWSALREASKYCTFAQGHKQAVVLSDVLLGKAKKKDLVDNIRKKFRRESVRLLGLLPLSTDKARDYDLLDRYKVLQEYFAYARKLSALTKESAFRAYQIGIGNLARTAGYPDPLRLEWAMESESIADLARAPVRAAAAGVEVTLAIDTEGQPLLTITKKGNPQKSLPAEAKKNPRVAELVARKKELTKQAARVRLSLEAAMCRGDGFGAAELKQLFSHPILRPQLERLVLIGEGIAGYPVSDGRALRNCRGKVEPIKSREVLRIAHAHDLLQLGDWHEWQRDCFAAERVQPFKQVFRELYVLTAQEKKDKDKSRRYAGHQVHPRQAAALWGSRAWSVNEEDGVRRTFHDVGLSAWVTFEAGSFTPAEIEGWSLEKVCFSKKGEWKALPLVDVPARLFSEVMRDVDLVVSVAHRGGVDPEASASTVEMRAALLRETCDLLQLGNVRLKKDHAFIDGQLANYNVHLGSGIVHGQPGGHLCLVAVHAQHRGRLFLPFTDDDPKTAEVVSKVLLLARDSEIQDPSILDQVRASG